MKDSQTEGDHVFNMTKRCMFATKLLFVLASGNPIKVNFENNVPMVVTVARPQIKYVAQIFFTGD